MDQGKPRIMDKAAPIDWQHPTGRAPKTVLITALGPSKHDLIEHQTGHEPDQALHDVDEVWGVNAGANWLSGRVAFDVLWVLDYLEGEAARLPRYVQQLEAWVERHQKPVITSVAGRYTWAHEYPLAWVWAHAKQYNPAEPYLHNSIPMILAYAWALGVEKCYLFGVDYTHERLQRREDDRANAEYWVGWCRAMGMQIIYPETTTFCNANQGFRVYGYPPGTERHPQFSNGEVTMGGDNGEKAVDTMGGPAVDDDGLGAGIQFEPRDLKVAD